MAAALFPLSCKLESGDNAAYMKNLVKQLKVKIEEVLQFDAEQPEESYKFHWEKDEKQIHASIPTIENSLITDLKKISGYSEKELLENLSFVRENLSKLTDKDYTASEQPESFLRHSQSPSSIAPKASMFQSAPSPSPSPSPLNKDASFNAQEEQKGSPLRLSRSQE